MSAVTQTKPNQESPKEGCHCPTAIGITALVTAIALLVIGIVIASGIWNISHFYFIAAGVVASSLIPFSIAACKLMH